MTIFLPRSAWTTHGPVKPMRVMATAPLRGFAVHWPGSGDEHIDAKNQHAIAARLEGYRAYHVSNAPGHGWSDIAYQAAVDLEGRVWDCRGIKWMSAANGNQSTNASHGAILLMLGSKDKASPAMLQAVNDFRRKVWLERYPKATRVVGHGDLWKTDCPGREARLLVKSGAFLRPPPPVKPPVPPVPPKPPVVKPKPKIRTPLVTSYVYGDGTKDSQFATAVACQFGLSQLFNPTQAKQAADQNNKVVVLGGAAVAALGLKVPVGATTVVGNYVAAFGHDGEETLVRGISAAKTVGG